MRNPKGCWLECAVAALALFCTLGLNINAFSVYLPYLADLVELNPNQSSNLLLVRCLCALGTVYIAKFYYEKLDIKLGYSLVMLLTVLGMFLYSRASGFAELCMAAVISGISYGLGGMYPVAILIHRWFPLHESLAMGICSASSGLAITVGAPIITGLIERHSLKTAMEWESIFLLLCTLICFALLRNYPEAPLHYTHRAKTKRSPLRINLMFFVITAIGIMGGAFGYISIHYTAEGFSPFEISTIMSIIGICLIGAKFLLGEMFDLWGGYRTNWLFIPIAILGCVAFSFGSSAGMTMAIAAACLYGIGDSVATVGIAVYAKDLSRPEEFGVTQQQYQFACQLGNVLCTLIPGPIATVTGNYRGFFLLIAVLMIFAFFALQYTYRRLKK